MCFPITHPLYHHHLFSSFLSPIDIIQKLREVSRWIRQPAPIQMLHEDEGGGSWGCDVGIQFTIFSEREEEQHGRAAKISSSRSLFGIKFQDGRNREGEKLLLILDDSVGSSLCIHLLQRFKETWERIGEKKQNNYRNTGEKSYFPKRNIEKFNGFRVNFEQQMTTLKGICYRNKTFSRKQE